MKNFLPYIIVCLFLLFFPVGIHKTSALQSPPVKIAILDTSAYLQHPDLEDHIVGGYDFVTNQPIPFNTSPTTFHGTHIAGIICGTQHTTGTYPDAKILYYVVDTPYAPTYHQNISKAIYRAIQDGAKIINFSGKLHYNLTDASILKAISYARANDILFVKSVGNSGPKDWSVSDLATSPLAVSVGAYDDATGHLYARSSKGPAFGTLRIKPDIIAPGVDILSSAPATQDLYIKASGTSMSAAYVSGILGNLSQQRPDLSSDWLLSALMTYASPLNTPEGNPYSVTLQGSGVVNLEASSKAHMLCLPYQLCFSLLSPDEAPPSFSTSLTLRNTSSKPLTYALTFEKEQPDAPYTVNFPTTITLAPLEEKSIPFQVALNGLVTPDHYGGRLYITGPNSIQNIPFLLEIPGADFPLARGLTLSHDVVSFSRTPQFSFLLETSVDCTASLEAISLESNERYELFSAKALPSGINELGWNGYALDGSLLPDGLYEIICTTSTGSLHTTLEDVILMIDNTAPFFKSIHFKESDDGYNLSVTLDDLMIPYSYVVNIVYRDYEVLPSPLSLSYSFNDLNYYPFYLEPSEDTITFTVPTDCEKIYLRAMDLSGNRSTRCLLIPSAQMQKKQE